uniref:Regulatory protein zeste n=1 Tax=Plectus sambesii TaxID=2011161 RepID=A0A914VDG5_9BILA
MLQTTSGMPLFADLLPVAEDNDRTRKPNFSEADKMLLLRMYQDCRKILMTRSMDAATIRQKQDAWQAITNALNERNPTVQRTVGEVRKKWQNLFAMARREVRAAESSGNASVVEQLPWLVKRIVELGNGVDDGDDISLDAQANYAINDASANESTAEDRSFLQRFKDEPQWEDAECASFVSDVGSSLQRGGAPPLATAHVIANDGGEAIGRPRPQSMPVTVNGAANAPCGSSSDRASATTLKRMRPSIVQSPLNEPFLPATASGIAQPAAAEDDTSMGDLSYFRKLERKRRTLEFNHQRQMWALAERKARIECELLELERAKRTLELEERQRQVASGR